jgi:transposase
LTGGQAHDCPAAERLIRRVKKPKRMLGDKAYDSAKLREESDENGTKPVIPNRSNRKQPSSFSKRLYKLRRPIEAAFNRLKDFRRIATRYDKLGSGLIKSSSARFGAFPTSSRQPLPRAHSTAENDPGQHAPTRWARSS